MGTIPFPSAAPNGIQIAEAAPNAFAEYARAAGLKAQTQGQNLQNQQLKQQNDMTQAVNQAYQGAFDTDANGNKTLNPDKLQQALASNGHGAAIPSVIKGITDYQKSRGDLQKQQQDLQKGSADAMGSLGYALQQAKYDPRLAHTIIEDHLNDSSLTLQQRQQLVQEQQQITQHPEMIQSIADNWVAQSPAQQERAVKDRDASAKEKQAQADADKVANEQWKPFPELGMLVNTKTGEQRSVGGAAGMLTPAMQENKYLTIKQKQNSGQPLGSGDKAFVKSYEDMKTLGQRFTLNATTTGGGMIPGAGQPGGQGGPPPTVENIPASIAGRVKAIMDYRAPLPPAGRNNPTNSAISYWVNQLDPQHDETNFPARNKLMTAFTSGSESHTINALNTGMGHLGVLGDAIDGLQNGNVKLLNKVANDLGVQVGATPQTTFNTIVHRVGPEVTAAYVQGGGGEGERGTTEKDFDPSLGPDQLKNNVAISAQLMRSKLGSLENQYKQTMNRDDFNERFITPEAKKTLDKWSPQGGANGGGQGSGLSVKAPNGKTYTFKDQASADNFKRAAGIP